MDAIKDETITENFQMPTALLAKNNVKLNEYEKFYRVATEPLYRVQVTEFFKDLD